MRSGFQLYAAAAVALALTAANACGRVERVAAGPARHSSSVRVSPLPPPSRSAPPALQPSQISTLRGGGGWLSLPLFHYWNKPILQLSGSVGINYQEVGDAVALQALQKGDFTFASSEIWLEPAQLDDMRMPLTQIALSASPICIAYSLPKTLFPLKLDGTTLASIFLHQTTSWDDPSIEATNPGVKLPSMTIIPIHELAATGNDESGESVIFANYLDAVSPRWHDLVGGGGNPHWPTDQQTARGAGGVAEELLRSDGGIGYMGCADARARSLSVVEVMNQSKQFVAPTPANARIALDSFLPQLLQSVRINTVNTAAPQGYPIVGLTFLVFQRDATNQPAAQALSRILDWALDPNAGQAQAAAAGYIPLPAALAQQERQMLHDRFNPAIAAHTTASSAASGSGPR